ncbi:hypothetical protein [Rhizobium sp. CCGE 510]|uniref:hypothetical protein n=1 Tax=Rhizobium sp. CCGE 510 TaxID=1132836 RepID=UPI00027B91F9|nr:hypothetical protein [Rhizobium sp. CCGE 510]EJT05413.1 hypothetical protein RCCGE510_09290 [Rhizobium sp. CCGE 510]
MNDSILREPQVELFFQPYFLGMTLGHLPFFLGYFEIATMVLKFILSLPIVFILFVFYRVRYNEINSRPFWWAFIVFVLALLLVVVMLLFLFADGDGKLYLPAVFLAFSLPSVLVACVAFPVLLRLRLRREKLP